MNGELAKKEREYYCNVQRGEFPDTLWGFFWHLRGEGSEAGFPPSSSWYWHPAVINRPRKKKKKNPYKKEEEEAVSFAGRKKGGKYNRK